MGGVSGFRNFWGSHQEWKSRGVADFPIDPAREKRSGRMNQPTDQLLPTDPGSPGRGRCTWPARRVTAWRAGSRVQGLNTPIRRKEGTVGPRWKLDRKRRFQKGHADFSTCEEPGHDLTFTQPHQPTIEGEEVSSPLLSVLPQGPLDLHGLRWTQNIF